MDESKIVFVKQQAGVEDLLMGFGSVSQIREGANTTINLVNAHTIPYDATRSVGDVLDYLLSFHEAT